jgi:hypothetical protein
MSTASQSRRRTAPRRQCPRPSHRVTNRQAARALVRWTDRQEMTRFEETWLRRRPGPLVRSPKAPDLASYYGIDPAYFDQARTGTVWASW